MRKILDYNIGESDVRTVLNRLVADNPQLNAQIETVHNETNTYLCQVLRIYPYEDKALVKIIDTNTNVFCRLSHEILGNGMCVDYLPNGIEKEDKTDYVGKRYVQPFDNLYGILIKVRWNNLSDENVLLGYVNIHDNNELKSSNDMGEVSIKSGSSIISVDDKRINIMTPSLFVNGLPYNEPELDNYYDKKEINVITDSLKSSTFDELLEVIEDYKETTGKYYTLFRGDCWTINNNYESSASITSRTNTSNESSNNRDFKVTGTFRTDSDLVGVYWNSKDLIEHPYISYGSKYDYRNVILEFDYSMTGCREWNDPYNSETNTNPCVLTINKTDGSIYYIVMTEFITGHHVKIDFNNLYLHQHNVYLNSDGQSVEVQSDMKVNVDDIESIMLMLKPEIQHENGEYNIINNVDFECEVTNITVKNGNIRKEHIDLEPHQYRLCEGYDDFYNFNPKRIVREMRKLGYVEWLDLYIGASHFYEKSGNTNERITTLEFNHTRTEKMVLDKNVPLNKAFIEWLDCYSRELKKNDCPNLVISVSMENLQCPQSWRQKTSSGDFAITGWIPSTFFYSPCNPEPVEYMEKVSKACLDIVVNNGMKPILQMGEAWWWWNENDKPNQPPCFYDDATKDKYFAKFGKQIPVYSKSRMAFDLETIKWLNQELTNYSYKLREVVKQYDGGLYMALFFPPSVTDVDRVPKMMRDVNYLKDAYSPRQLDILQLEDYDWVIEESKHHDEVYSLGEELGFPVNRLHYFGGFVQYEKDAKKFWRLIKDSMKVAIAKGFAEVFVWAGSQVRRDKKMIGYEGYEVVQYLIND